MGHNLVENFGKACLELQANVYGGPLRQLKWWDKTKIEGWKASDEIWRIAREIIGKYRDKHSESYIAVDTSFIGRLVRAPYPTEDDRLAELVSSSSIFQTRLRPSRQLLATDFSSATSQPIQGLGCRVYGPKKSWLGLLIVLQRPPDQSMRFPETPPSSPGSD